MNKISAKQLDEIVTSILDESFKEVNLSLGLDVEIEQQKLLMLVSARMSEKVIAEVLSHFGLLVLGNSEL